MVRETWQTMYLLALVAAVTAAALVPAWLLVRMLG